MRRILAAVTAVALLPGCVSHVLRQGHRDPPRREAGLVIAGAVLEAAAASLIAAGLADESSGGGGCEEPCDYVGGTGSALGSLLFGGALMIIVGGSALGDLGVGGLQLATGSYVRETWTHATVHVIDDEITLDGARIATPQDLTAALSLHHPRSVVIEPSAGIDCGTLSAVEDAVRAAAVDDVSVTHACVSSR